MEFAYLKVADISKITGVKEEVVRKWCRCGRLKSYKPGGKEHLIKREDFEEFMEASATKEASE